MLLSDEYFQLQIRQQIYFHWVHDALVWHLSIRESSPQGCSALGGLTAGSPCLQLSPLPLHPMCCPQSGGSRVSTVVAAAQLKLLRCLNMSRKRWQTYTFPSVMSATRIEVPSRGPKQTAGGRNNEKQLARNFLETLENRCLVLQDPQSSVL